jgi:hypothetical protein
MHHSLIFVIVLLVPFISAGTLYGISTPGGNKLNVYTIDPQVGKATANVTSLYLINAQGTCDKLLVSFENRSQEMALSCDDDLYYVSLWWNWRVSQVNRSPFNTNGAVVNIVPSWSEYTEGGNCALVVNPPSTAKDASMGDITCFSFGSQSDANVAYGPYPFLKKEQQFVFSTPGNNIGIFHLFSQSDVLLWGKSLVDNSSNLVYLDRRNIMLAPWNSFMEINIANNLLYGATSYSSPLMGNLTVIELTSGVIVLDLTTKSISNPYSFCQGHSKIGSSAFDPVNKMMYSLVSCNTGPMLVTFDIQNRAVKNAAKFDESTLSIKGLFYTLY